MSLARIRALASLVVPHARTHLVHADALVPNDFRLQICSRFRPTTPTAGRMPAGYRGVKAADRRLVATIGERRQPSRFRELQQRLRHRNSPAARATRTRFRAFVDLPSRLHGDRRALRASAFEPSISVAWGLQPIRSTGANSESMATNDVARGRLPRAENHAGAGGVRVLLLAGDPFPPKRVDVTVLYGEELSKRGHRIDWLMQSEAHCPRAYVKRYAGGVAFVGPTDTGSSLARRVRKHVLGIAHDLKVFGLLRTNRYDVVEVKDKFVSGVFALVAARIFGAKFVYW